MGIRQSPEVEAGGGGEEVGGGDAGVVNGGDVKKVKDWVD